MQNGHVESFHGSLRDECLNASWFRTLNDVRRTLDSWRQEYNCERTPARSPTERLRSSAEPWAMEMRKANNASHAL
jgi:transposase InsO family protein